ncbi:MAG TPA: hypothetical protein VGR11_02725 [Solirubrobacteraceae bacterium]|nr:hypothetical protein [Solirubrobacteraceae bacterium]
MSVVHAAKLAIRRSSSSVAPLAPGSFRPTELSAAAAGALLRHVALIDDSAHLVDAAARKAPP